MEFRVIALLITAFTISVLNADSMAQSDSPDFWQVQRIDELVATVWNDFEIKPSKEAKDAEWCRRLFLDVLGRIPKVDELDRFVSDRSKTKREDLVADLIHGDDYTEEFARNWTTIWTNLLIGRTGGNGRDTMINRAGMQKFLRDSFARNKPFDRFVRELVSASGSTTPGEDDFNGATNFLVDKVNSDKGSLATASTSRLFLGLQVQCTQCHDHPFNDWKQQKYWEMNAFFRQAKAFRGGRRNENAPAKLVDQDFGGERRPRNLNKPPVFFELRNGEMRVAYPVFIDGTPIDPSGYVKVVNRRQELSKLITDSEYFPKAIVNRTWGHFLGYGFTSPIDDLGPHNPPTHPELLGFLGEEFRNSGFDIRELISWIVLSKPYSLSSRIGRGNKSDNPLLGETPKFSRFYLRQMRAEELYESLLAANQGKSSSGDYQQQERLKNRWLQQFSVAFGTDEGDETTTFNGTIPQVLMMFNGELIRNATGGTKGSMVRQLASSNLSYARQIEHLYKAGLSRAPKRSEQQLAQDFLNVYDGNTDEALKDMWWVILNSNEFIFNH